MTPELQVEAADWFSVPTVTRFPFRYGIAAMTEAPHLLLQCRVAIDGAPATGVTSESLPPKWFTKNPETTFEEDDLPGMLGSIHSAAESARGIGEPLAYFEFWRALKQAQDDWARAAGVPSLLAQFGTALIERAVLDALCRSLDQPLHRVVRENRLGVRLGEVHAELEGTQLRDVLSPPLEQVAVRHTIGLADPLTDEEIPAEDRADDGLPQSLAANIRAYGLTHFKIKLQGRRDADRQRLQALAKLLPAESPGPIRITVDGNEQYRSVEAFRDDFCGHRTDPALAPLMDRLLFVEQPLHRSIALGDAVGKGFSDWPDAPPVIIDESDGDVADLPRALELGYAGTSHKNCKGVLKSLVNRALIDRRGGVLSAEDLACLGPVAMLQDLAMVALLGITHGERNGHHYFAGLSMFPPALQDRVLAAHGDLYKRGPGGWAALSIENGSVSTRSVCEAPFGTALDPRELTAGGMMTGSGPEDGRSA